METLFVRKQKSVKAIQITETIPAVELERFFKDLGFTLYTIRKESIKPFLSRLERLEIQLVDFHSRKTTLHCFYEDYIYFEDRLIGVMSKSEFESQFESIEPILDKLAQQLG
jgi:transcription initiation factor IIE alpha subunit